jgi:septal ring factor EnvC (AmiA/AmiB activator)
VESQHLHQQHHLRNHWQQLAAAVAAGTSRKLWSPLAVEAGLCNPNALICVQEWEYAKVRQDAQLERIERGVGTLGDMAKGMQEELDKQNPVIDDIDTQLNKVTSQLKTNNAKLKGLVTQVGVLFVLLLLWAGWVDPPNWLCGMWALCRCSICCLLLLLLLLQQRV